MSTYYKPITMRLRQAMKISSLLAPIFAMKAPFNGYFAIYSTRQKKPLQNPRLCTDPRTKHHRFRMILR